MHCLKADLGHTSYAVLKQGLFMVKTGFEAHVKKFSDHNPWTTAGTVQGQVTAVERGSVFQVL